MSFGYRTWDWAVPMTVGQGRVAGWLDVMLAAYLASGFDTKNTAQLSGTLDATACPGTMQ
jgi:hypothetical protein